MHPMSIQQFALARAVCLLACPLAFLITTMLLLAGPLASLLKLVMPLYAKISVEFVNGSACCPPDTEGRIGACASVEHACGGETGVPGSFSFLFTGVAGGPFVRTHNFTALVPLCYATMLGVVVPCFLFLLAQYQIWRGEIRLEEEFLGRPWSQKRRKSNVIRTLRNYTRVVREEDYVILGDDCHGGGCAGEGTGRNHASQSSLMLPEPGCPSSEKYPATREIPNSCAICLSDYKVGDCLVWSSNKECQHAFHESCALPWLVRRRKCPLCRQVFVGPT